MTTSRSRPLAALLAVVAAAPLGCGGGDATAGKCDGGLDGEAWRTESSRQAEADRIVECRILVGRSKDEVRDLLGRPFQRDEANAWLYVTGPQRDFGSLDDEVLVVEFDTRQRVERVGLGNL